MFDLFSLDDPEVPPGEFVLVRVSRRAMATTFEVAVPVGTHRDPIRVATAALDLIDELEDQMTVYRDHSEVSRLNACAADAPVEVEERLFDLFERCAGWTHETEGAFDVATGAITRAWGFYSR
jgi:thiamine biosynthesis lipoprotein